LPCDSPTTKLPNYQTTKLSNYPLRIAKKYFPISDCHATAQLPNYQTIRLPVAHNRVGEGSALAYPFDYPAAWEPPLLL